MELLMEEGADDWGQYGDGRERGRFLFEAYSGKEILSRTLGSENFTDEVIGAMHDVLSLKFAHLRVISS